jgi:hypothetical protein
MSDRPAFRVFERVRVTVSRYGVSAGEEGEISRVLGDGSVEVTVTDPPSALDRARLGDLVSHPPFAQRRSANFRPEELKRPWEH